MAYGPNVVGFILFLTLEGGMMMRTLWPMEYAWKILDLFSLGFANNEALFAGKLNLVPVDKKFTLYDHVMRKGSLDR